MAELTPTDAAAALRVRLWEIAARVFGQPRGSDGGPRPRDGDRAAPIETEAEVLYAEVDPARPMDSVRCKCGATFLVLAGAYQRAG